MGSEIAMQTAFIGGACRQYGRSQRKQEVLSLVNLGTAFLLSTCHSFCRLCKVILPAHQ